MSDGSKPEISKFTRRDFLKFLGFTAGVAGLTFLPEIPPSSKGIYVPSLGKNGEFVHLKKNMLLNEKNELLGPFEQFANLPYLANSRVENPYLRGRQFVDVTSESLRSEPWKKYMAVISEGTVGNGRAMGLSMGPDFTDVLYTTSNYLKWSEDWFQKELFYKKSREIDDLIEAGNTICFEFAVAVHCAMACLGQTTELFLITNKPHAIVVYNNEVQGDMVGDATFPDSGAIPLKSYQKLMSEKLNVSYLSLEKIKPAFKPLSALKGQ